MMRQCYFWGGGGGINKECKNKKENANGSWKGTPEEGEEISLNLKLINTEKVCNQIDRV